jgi:hypothetical protein
LEGNTHTEEVATTRWCYMFTILKLVVLVLDLAMELASYLVFFLYHLSGHSIDVD